MSAKVTIKSAADTRMVNGKNGARQIHFQNAQLETKDLRCQIELEIDGPNFAYQVGATKEWDIEADVIAGRFGPELARRMTLRDPVAATK